MDTNVASAGNSGPKIRSDCEVTLGLRDEGGVIVEIKSKVFSLYGESIKSQCLELLEFFGVKNAIIKVDDSGALPFVISARIEAAIKQLVETEREYLPPFNENNRYQTDRNRFRFSRLYIPGNNPAMMINAGLYSAEGIILDLEDSVAPARKDEARIMVRNALRQVDFGGAERMVRINQGERGIKDLEYIVPQNINLVLIPKCENTEAVVSVDKKISEITERHGLSGNIHLMPIIESALGIEKSYEIANSSENIVALAIGLEDFTADIGVQRTTDGRESLYARTRLVNAAKASGRQPVDSVFADVADMEGLKKSVAESKSLGFEGMGCIHPLQIPVIREGYAPGEEEIERSKNIVVAYAGAVRRGLGVVALGSKMIDPPVVARAVKIIDLSVSLGLLPVNWMDEISSDQNQ